MNWKNYFSTSIGKKLMVGFTGLFLIVFLVVHAYVNAMVFWPDNGAHFSAAAHFMGTNPVIRIAEIGLFVFLILHIIQGLALWFQNMKRRPVKYAVKPGNKTSKWYSRSMGILGSLILIFLAIHLSDFWAPNRYSQTFTAGHDELNLYARMIERFSHLWVVVVYVLGCFALAWHLVHGFYSSFQTFGLTTHKYKRLIYNVGVAFAIIVPIIFAMMPISMYMGWVN
jgi:succinate dehydrogenase / fumarate reductase, cytochrome b subunit